MKKRVYVTRAIPEKALKILEENFEVTVFPEKRPITKKEIMRLAKGYDGILPLLTDEIDEKVMEKTGIKAIANFAVGVDNIDIKAASARKIPVTNTPGVLTDATADLTWALILAVTRRIVEADNYLRSGRWKGWDPLLLLGGDLRDKTLGIIGLGRIGRAVAERAKGFGMNVIYNSRTAFDGDEKYLGIRFVSLEELLKESDFVSIHAPHTEQTHHLIGMKQLEMMKHTAYLINTSRGKLVNEEDLILALQEGKIAGAGLDVFYDEPKVNKELFKFPNVVLLPHIGSASLQTRTKMAVIAAENMVEALQNQRPRNIVNPEIYD